MIKTTITEELKAGKTVVYYTVGISMRPLLVERKTHVIMEPLTAAKDKDILLYIRKNGDNVLHRLIKQDAEHYYMRGDNTVGLEKISKSQAVGVVSGIYGSPVAKTADKYIDVETDEAYKAYVKKMMRTYPLRFVRIRLKQVAIKILKTYIRRERK